jgi:hypothetical protein
MSYHVGYHSRILLPVTAMADLVATDAGCGGHLLAKLVGTGPKRGNTSLGRPRDLGPQVETLMIVRYGVSTERTNRRRYGPGVDREHHCSQGRHPHSLPRGPACPLLSGFYHFIPQVHPAVDHPLLFTRRILPFPQPLSLFTLSRLIPHQSLFFQLSLL